MKTIDDYETVQCGDCGGTEKTLIVRACTNGYAHVIIRCDHCGLGNKFDGAINPECVDT